LTFPIFEGSPIDKSSHGQGRAVNLKDFIWFIFGELVHHHQLNHHFNQQEAFSAHSGWHILPSRAQVSPHTEQTAHTDLTRSRQLEDWILNPLGSSHAIGMQRNKENWKMRWLNKAPLLSQNEVYLTGLSAVENSETSAKTHRTFPCLLWVTWNHRSPCSIGLFSPNSTPTRAHMPDM